MKEAAKIFLIRISALLTLVISAVTALSVLRAMVFGTDGGAACVFYALLIASAGFCAGLCTVKERSGLTGWLKTNKAAEFLFFLLNKTPSSTPITSAAAHLAVIIPAAAVYVLYMDEGVFRAIFEALAAALLYYAGLRANYYEPGDMMSRRKIYAGIALLVLSLIAATYYNGCRYLRPYVFGASYAFALIALILKNQESLDYYILSRKDLNASRTVKNIRKYNMTITVLLFIILLLLFNLRYVAAYAVKITAALVFLAVFLFFWLFSFLMSPGQGGGKGEGQLPQELMEKGTGNPIVDIILQVLFAVVLIYLLIRFFPHLVKRLKSVILRIIAFLASLMKRVTGLPEEAQQAHDFIDETEIIAPEKTAKGLRLISGLAFLRRNAGRAADLSARLRQLYAGLLRFIAGRGIVFTRTDTAREIMKKTCEASGADVPMERLTAAYEKVRYGGSPPGPEDIASAEDDLRNIKALLRKVKGPRNG